MTRWPDFQDHLSLDTPCLDLYTMWIRTLSAVVSLRKSPTFTHALPETNRRIACKSTGSRTVRGKAQSCLNGLESGGHSPLFQNPSAELPGSTTRRGLRNRLPHFDPRTGGSSALRRAVEDHGLGADRHARRRVRIEFGKENEGLPKSGRAKPECY